MTGNPGKDLVPMGTLATIDAEIVEFGAEEEIFNYIRPSEAHSLIQATSTPRDHLLFNTFWQSGGRVSELLKIRPIDITNSGIHIETMKQRYEKKRRTSIGTWVLRKEPVLKKKIVRRNIPIKSELRSEFMTYAFNTRLTPTDCYFPISSRRVEQILDELAKKAQITYKKLHPHLFRHGFAANFINQGGALHKLQKILGHSNIQTTMIYLKLSAH